MEALSDGVFALAIAILLLSSSVPKNFEELELFIKDLLPFGVCILFIYWIWRQQCLFFMRYGLVDGTISILNLALLFFLLFYVYPLKFLMTWLLKYMFAVITGNLNLVLDQLTAMIPMEKLPHLMIIYGLGFVLIWLCLYFMYRYALSKSKELDLVPVEIYETRFSMNEKLYLALIGVLSVLLSLFSILLNFPVGAAFAGWVYNLIWIIAIIRLKQRKRQLKVLRSDL